MYSCYVEGCTIVFKIPQKRKCHLVDFHKFPKDFKIYELIGSDLNKKSPSIEGKTMEITNECDSEGKDSSHLSSKVPNQISFGKRRERI